jgi:DNA replication protein DnaC
MDDALVGRGPELVVLGDFLTRSAADGGALLLTGEPGVGKTALLQAAAARAAQADTRVTGPHDRPVGFPTTHENPSH